MKTNTGMWRRINGRNGQLPMIILFLAPAIVLYLYLFINPSLQAFYISLFDWNGFTSEMKYVGLRNFTELSRDGAFWDVAVKNTMKIIFIGGFFIFAIGFLISGLLATKIRGRKIMRALIFLPAIINPIAVAILWSFIYNQRWGLLNNLLSAVGLGSLARAWMAPDTLFASILVALIWTYTGFYCVIILAALDRIPDSYIESAKLDGASEFQTFFKIKLPMIKGVLGTAVTLWVITAVKEFALLFAWGGGVDIPPAGATNLAVRMYITAFGRRVTIYRMGYATAMGVIMFLIVAVSVVLVSRLFKSDSLEY